MNGTDPTGTDALPGAEPGAAGEDWVHLDELGTTQPRWQGGTVTALVAGLPERARSRLDELGMYELHEDPGKAADADLVLVSTRLPRGDLTGFLAAVRHRAGGPLVALVHTGGEGLAVEVMRAGGAGVVAEGNEEAVAAYLAGSGHDTALVDTFERQLAQATGGGDPARDRDRVTGLPGPSAFEQRLAELAKGGDVPRLAFLRLLHMSSAERPQRNERAASDLVRRRLSMQFKPLVRAAGAEMFSLGEFEFALVGERLSAHAAEHLGGRLATVAARFAPSGHTPLALALGHAGSEVSQELPTLRELAQRALEVAAVEKNGAVVNADRLSLGVSSTTEFEAAVRMVAFVEQRDPYPPGHGGRVAELAAELANQLGYEGPAGVRIRLAALLHDVGKVGLPDEAVVAGPSTGGEIGEAYRSHPVRGADYLRVSAGDDVAAAVRGHHECWDGSGFPDGLAGEDIPIAARIVAVADAFDDAWHTAGADGRQGPEAGMEALRALAGERLDPSLVEIALGVVARTYGLSPQTPVPA